MSEPRHHLQVEEDMIFQRREWRVQRAGWWALSVFVVLAVLGLFGGGPLSRAVASTADGALRVEYERFVRVGSRSHLAIRTGAASTGTELQVRIDREYFEAVDVERIVPEPRSIGIGERTVTLAFARPPAEAQTIVIALKPRAGGAHEARIETGAGGQVTIEQLAYF